MAYVCYSSTKGITQSRWEGLLTVSCLVGVDIQMKKHLFSAKRKEYLITRCAGVYKRTPEGQAAFKKFLECI